MPAAPRRASPTPRKNYLTRARSAFSRWAPDGRQRSGRDCQRRCQLVPRHDLRAHWRIGSVRVDDDDEVETVGRVKSGSRRFPPGDRHTAGDALQRPSRRGVSENRAKNWCAPAVAGSAAARLRRGHGFTPPATRRCRACFVSIRSPGRKWFAYRSGRPGVARFSAAGRKPLQHLAQNIAPTNREVLSAALDLFARRLDELREKLASRELEADFDAANELYKLLRSFPP